MDIKKASDEIKEARFETKKASVDLKETHFETKKASGELTEALSETKRVSSETKKASGELTEALSETKKILVELGDARREARDARKELAEARKELISAREEAKGLVEVSRESAKRTQEYEQQAQQAEQQLRLQLSRNSAAEVASSIKPSDINPTVRVGLVSEVKELSMGTLKRVATVLQRQVSRDVKPIWSVDAKIDVFKTSKDVPSGVWPMIIRKDIGVPGAVGFHSDKDGVPYSLVTHSSDIGAWTVTASYELLDMLVDPFGKRTIPGPSPNPADRSKVVNFLVEICQPVGGNAYKIDGVQVSDFVKPAFYDPLKKDETGEPYSFKGTVKEPGKIAKGGYMSWQDKETNEWHQATWFLGEAPVFRNLGKID